MLFQCQLDPLEMTMTHDHTLIRLLDELVKKKKEHFIRNSYPVWSKYVVLLSADKPICGTSFLGLIE